MAPTRLYAHRGFSSRQPEMTLAAYQEAISWSMQERVPLGLECDVRLTADDQLVCLHDATLGRTADAVGSVSNWTLAELAGWTSAPGGRLTRRPPSAPWSRCLNWSNWSATRAPEAPRSLWRSRPSTPGVTG